MDPRTRTLLEAPILPTLLRLAIPNLIMTVVQGSVGLIDIYFVAKLGTDAVAGVSLVFPGLMLMQMMAGGAMGGGVSSAVARALGAGRREDADAILLHALVIGAIFAAFFSAVMLAGGPWLYAMLGGHAGAVFDTALTYSNIVFAGVILIWTYNVLANVIRGGGNTVVPAFVTIAGVALLIPLSPTLIFGLGPLPALGVKGGAIALLTFYGLGSAIYAAYLLTGRSVVRPSGLRARLRWPLFYEIFRVGLLSSVTSLMTNVTIALATGLAAVFGAAAIAGYGVGTRLEYMLVPLSFGFGGALVAMVGTNIGGGKPERALRAAWIGGWVSFAITETIGVMAALFPAAWLSLFTSDAQVIEAGSVYLRMVGPFYGFFGLGMSLYFASQGAGALKWPLLAGLLRMVVAVGGGWLVLKWTGSLALVFLTLGVALAVFGIVIAVSVWRGVWFRGSK